jgi:hypothetical protein
MCVLRFRDAGAGGRSSNQGRGRWRVGESKRAHTHTHTHTPEETGRLTSSRNFLATENSELSGQGWNQSMTVEVTVARKR